MMELAFVDLEALYLSLPVAVAVLVRRRTREIKARWSVRASSADLRRAPHQALIIILRVPFTFGAGAPAGQ